MRGSTWLVLLAALAVAFACGDSGGGGETGDPPHSLRFQHGDGEAPAGDYGVMIPVYGRTSNIGAGDFTVEMWLRAEPDSLLAWGGCQAGPGQGASWLQGHVVLDRSLIGSVSFIGLSLFGDAIAFGIGDVDHVEGGVCEPAYFNGGEWHHVAAVRAGSDVKIFVDGVSTTRLADFEGGDVSYQGGDTPASTMILGGWKTENQVAPWRGWIDELRISTVARYPLEPSPDGPFEADADTAVLYHFDRIQAEEVVDSSLADPIDAVRAESGGWLVKYDDETPF